ncbi:Longitudinals lacking protein-like [Portunus trituberculatus]|uniref:Longitudinals lacking protein-like n=1 Tax=Portunus trituberculatus TaxID=210409 RepID=A0A5B7DYJ2_PORTR|nr:Longitudinals lacking protein-like [Portunus trituberculatus]
MGIIIGSCKIKKTYKMADDQQFCLRWNEFQSNMVSSFKHLREEKSFTDVTLACDGQTCKAHKMVLSACSPYFKALLEVWFVDMFSIIDGSEEGHCT